MVNYDLPVKHDTPSEPDYEVYLHRIGRTGRFGRKGERRLFDFLEGFVWGDINCICLMKTGAVFNLICGDRDKMIMDKIEQHFAHVVPEVIIICLFSLFVFVVMP